MKKLLVSRGIAMFPLLCFILVWFAPPAQADLWTFDDAFGHHAQVDATVSGNVLTVQLTNTATVPTTTAARAISGVFFDVTGGGAVISASASGRRDLVSRYFPDFVTPAAVDISNGWGFAQGLPAGGIGTFGIAASGLSGLGPWSFNVPMDNDPVVRGGLNGPPYLLVAPYEIQNRRNMEVQSPWTYGTATFTFTFEGTPTLDDNGAVFTYGTGPDFVTPLPGAVLLGFLGLGLAGMKLRRIV